MYIFFFFSEIHCIFVFDINEACIFFAYHLKISVSDFSHPFIFFSIL